MWGVELNGVRIHHLEVGQGSDTKGQVHEKTVPFGIVAQATSGTYELHTESGTSTITGSEAFLTPAHLPLRIKHNADPATGIMSYRYVHFHFYLMDTLDFFQLYNLPLACNEEKGCQFGELIEQLLLVKAQERNGASSIVTIVKKNELAYRLLSLLLELASPSERSSTLLSFTHELHPVLNYIYSHWYEEIDIQTLLDIFAGSRSLLFRCFNKLFQQTPMEYVKSIRLKESYRELCTSDKSITEIALKNGFANSFHFSREFSAKFNMTPTAARKANRLWIES
jgi:AraC-like DNA-binding protein